MGKTFTLNWVVPAIIYLLLGTFVEIDPVFFFIVLILAAITISFEQILLYLFVVFVAFAGLGKITPPVWVSINICASVIQEIPASVFREVPLFGVIKIFYGITVI